MKNTTKEARAARNAFRLLSRRDARAVRRRKYWIRQYGDTLSDRHATQVSFQLACAATGTDINRWLDMGSSEPATVHLGGGVFVKDTPERLEALRLLDD